MILPAGPEHGGPAWVERTWWDVVEGDVVRPPGTDLRFVVAHASRAPWHVHPAANEYRPNEMPAEWTDIRVRFQDGDAVSELRSMRPDAPVEIMLDAEELAAIETLGWENRVRMADTAPNPGDAR